MGALSKILSGRIEQTKHLGDFTAGMIAAQTSLLSHERQLTRLWRSKLPNEFKRNAPPCARLILEQGLAMILGRMDPIRFVAMVKGSNSADFKIGQRNASSFNWNKEVFPDVRPSAGGYWSQESIAKSIHRSVLDGHLADYLFNSCHMSLIETLTDTTSKLDKLPEWVIQLLKFEKGDHALAAVRSKANEAYSVLSKGIHFEFFLGKSTTPEAKEIKDATTKAIAAASTIALYSHFSDISVYRMKKTEAIRCFLLVAEKFQ